MSYSKVQAEAILKGRLEEYDRHVKEIKSKIEGLEREKTFYLALYDEATFALSVTKQMRASNVRDPEPEMTAEPEEGENNATRVVTG